MCFFEFPSPSLCVSGCCVDLSTKLAKDVEGESLSDLLYVYALRDDQSAAVLQVQAEGVTSDIEIDLRSWKLRRTSITGPA